MKKTLLLFTLLLSASLYAQISLIPFSPASNPTHFGSEVDTFGNEIIVTATNTTNMSQSKVFVFEKTESDFIETNVLLPSDGIPTDEYGQSISINTNFIAVGSPNNNQVGAVYLYQKVNGTWQFTQKLTAFDGSIEDYYGNKVKIYNNQLFVSAPKDEPDGQPSTTNNGSVYIYNYDGSNWVFSQKLTLSNPFSKNFGTVLDVENNKLVISSGGYTVINSSISTYTFDGTNWVDETLMTPFFGGTTFKDFCLNSNSLFIISDNMLRIYSNNNGNWSVYSVAVYGIGYNYFTRVKAKNNLLLLGASENSIQTEHKSLVLFCQKNATGNGWNWTYTLQGNGPVGYNDSFGCSLAISETLIAIGADNEGIFPYGKVYTSDATLGINENLLNEFKIYPNPTTEQIFISEEFIDEISYIEISQLDGKIIKKIVSNFSSISLSEFQSGIYLLKLVNNNGTSATKKIVKI
jgi:hypothetical protein